MWDQDGTSAGMEQEIGELLVSDIWYQLMSGTCSRSRSNNCRIWKEYCEVINE